MAVDPIRGMTNRFWIGTALALPVFLLAMSHLLPGVGAWAVTPGYQAQSRHHVEYPAEPDISIRLPASSVTY